MYTKNQYRALLILVDPEEKPVIVTEASAFYEDPEDLLTYLHLNQHNINHLALKLCETFEISSQFVRMALECNTELKPTINLN
jgi:hypothetical protein